MLDIASSFGFNFSRTITSISILVLWIKPDTGVVKLNCDGAKKTTHSHGGIGGVLRDSNGNIIWAFSDFIEECPNSLYAEAAALLRGLQLLDTSCTTTLWIETDSKLLWQILSHNHLGHWKLHGLLNKIHTQLSHFEVSITHIYREGNKAADALANIGFHQQTFVQYSSNSTPRAIQGFVRVDQLEIPAFRFRNQY
ncbi:hypothetical protein DH2020_042933 [Rehmannia glutinosa]|uniref:RNase H type-1 domain-containing protein n=1 Tax=Rehmannia glutinosa TaxID=99300 RepID=A0ABR0UL23_REHGL